MVMLATRLGTLSGTITLADDLQRCSAHALGGLDDAGVHLADDWSTDQTGYKREGRNDQRHDGSRGADGGAHDQTGQRDAP